MEGSGYFMPVGGDRQGGGGRETMGVVFGMSVWGLEGIMGLMGLKTLATAPPQPAKTLICLISRAYIVPT